MANYTHVNVALVVRQEDANKLERRLPEPVSGNQAASWNRHGQTPLDAMFHIWWSSTEIRDTGEVVKWLESVTQGCEMVMGVAQIHNEYDTNCIYEVECDPGFPMWAKVWDDGG